MLKKATKHFFQNSYLFLLLILGTFLWSLTMVKSGLCWQKGCVGGIGFWGANGHDGIWHLALINNLAKGNFKMPIFAGEVLTNYHFGFDIILAALTRLTSINPSVLYFQIFPPIAAFLIGWLTYNLVYKWKSSKTKAFWAVFFVYFCRNSLGQRWSN